MRRLPRRLLRTVFGLRCYRCSQDARRQRHAVAMVEAKGGNNGSSSHPKRQRRRKKAQPPNAPQLEDDQLNLSILDVLQGRDPPRRRKTDRSAVAAQAGLELLRDDLQRKRWRQKEYGPWKEQRLRARQEMKQHAPGLLGDWREVLAELRLERGRVMHARQLAGFSKVLPRRPGDDFIRTELEDTPWKRMLMGKGNTTELLSYLFDIDEPAKQDTEAVKKENIKVRRRRRSRQRRPTTDRSPDLG